MSDQAAESLEEQGRRLLQWMATTFNDGNLHGAQQATHEATGIPKGTINRYIKGKSRPNRKTLEIFRSFGASIPWLLSGEGPMYEPGALRGTLPEGDVLDFGDRKRIPQIGEPRAPYESRQSFEVWWEGERARLLDDITTRFQEVLQRYAQTPRRTS